MTKNEVKSLKIGLNLVVLLLLGQFVGAFLLFFFAGGVGISTWGSSWAGAQFLMYLPAFCHLILILLTCYITFFLWQLWKEVSFNGSLQRSRPESVPTISHTIPSPQLQNLHSFSESSHCNLGFTVEAPTYDGARSEEGSEKLSQEMGKSGSYTENLQLHSSSGVEAVTKEEQILSAEFECPICLDLMLPPRKIFQCIQGHPTCSWCLSQGLTFCPTCRGPFMGRARNMERIAAILLEQSVEVSAD